MIFFLKTNFLKKILFPFNKRNVVFLIKEPLFKTPLKISLSLLLLSLTLYIFFYSQLPPQLPLFYSCPWGESQLTAKITFLFLPLAFILLVFFNFILASFLFKKDIFLAQLISWSNVISSFLLSLTLIKILIIIV